MRISVFAVKSFALAVSSVPIDVDTVTLRVVCLSPVRVTVKSIALPSIAEAEVIVNIGNS